MTKRPLTPEEIREWRESNRFTVKKPGVVEQEAVAETPSPLAAERAVKPAHTTLPTPHLTSPARGEGRSRDAVPGPLQPLPQREARRLRGTHADIEAVLDLHGYGKLDAYQAVAEFLRRAQIRHIRHVVIITGKGRTTESVLRKELPHWLNEPHLRPLLSAFFHATPREGGGGVTHVILKRRMS